jgi:peptide-methionine (S)-S-oxide reductase
MDLQLGLIGTTLLLAVATAASAGTSETRTETAVFAGGCFWCMEEPFDEVDGVLETLVGYTGGKTVDPTYEQVSAGGTGHTEAIRVTFDPARVSYETLLDVYWHNIDPTVRDRQFCDTGAQYRTAIFVNGAAQRSAAERSKAALEATGRFPGGIMTEIVAAGPFYAAEEYHQDYAKKNPVRYQGYRWACQRDQRLKQLWGDEPDRD